MPKNKKTRLEVNPQAVKYEAKHPKKIDFNFAIYPCRAGNVNANEVYKKLNF